MCLENSPQLKCVVLKVRITTPKKPNSAKRAIIKSAISNLKQCLVYIPGIGHNLRKHSLVLVRYGCTQDLPSLYLKCIRGVYDLSPVLNRISRRSIYGVKQSNLEKKRLRKKFTLK